MKKETIEKGTELLNKQQRLQSAITTFEREQTKPATSEDDPGLPNWKIDLINQSGGRIISITNNHDLSFLLPKFLENYIVALRFELAKITNELRELKDD